MAFDWHSLGIKTRRSSGQEKTLCPWCSTSRTNKRDKCLSINHDEGVYRCHHCEISGNVTNSNQSRHWERPVKQYRRPEFKPSEETPEEKFYSWFAQRGISSDVVKRNGIEPRRMNDQRQIAFPYTRNGEVINVKYRSHDKRFMMESGAELCLYGLDDLIESESDMAIFTEGELDKLAFEEAGFKNCVSVPNGAGTNLDVFASSQDLLDSFDRYVWAGDNDEAGRRLEAEAIRRLGPERCYKVEWPSNCKDANDVLLKHGKERLAECVALARPIPIEGAFEINDIRQEIVTLYEQGRPKGVHPGWGNLNQLYRPRLGDWSVVTGVPGSGKSSFIANLLVNLSIQHKWRFVVFPPENLPPQEYASMVMEIYTGKPFDLGPTPRMTPSERDAAIDWAQEHFVILNPSEEQRDLDALLGMCKSYIFRRGVQGFVLDPWNELEHLLMGEQSMTNYIGQSLIKIRNFARTHRIHIWILAHPTKLQKDKDGNYPIPRLYDIEDSRHWYNKADMGITVHRDKSDDSKPVEIHVQKVRFRWCGQLGIANLYYDRVTGRYSEATPQLVNPRYWNETDAELVESAEEPSEEIPF